MDKGRELTDDYRRGFADGIVAAREWCEQHAIKAHESGRPDDAGMLETAAFCIDGLQSAPKPGG